MDLRERIIEEASNLFFQKGIKSITMSDIANHLGISKRTLYETFRDKEELLENCLRVSINNANNETKEIIRHSENAIDALIRMYAKHLNEMHSMNKSVVYDLKKYHPQLYKMIECEQKEGVEMFIPLFDKGVSQGLIRSDIKFEILIWLLKAQFKMLMEGEFIPTDRFPLTEFAEAIIFNFTRGIATPLGNKKIDELSEKIRNKKTDNL